MQMTPLYHRPSMPYCALWRHRRTRWCFSAWSSSSPSPLTPRLSMFMNAPWHHKSGNPKVCAFPAKCWQHLGDQLCQLKHWPHHQARILVEASAKQDLGSFFPKASSLSSRTYRLSQSLVYQNTALCICQVSSVCFHQESKLSPRAKTLRALAVPPHTPASVISALRICWWSWYRLVSTPISTSVWFLFAAYLTCLSFHACVCCCRK